MKLRQLLKAVDLEQVFKLINERDGGYAAACDRPSMETTVRAYTHVVKELLGKPKARAYSMPILIQDSIDPFDKKPFVDVCLLNRKYVAPRKGLKPWGGNPPKGHYNCNLSKHNRTFSMMGVPWSKLIDTPVVIESKCSLEMAVSRLLWEMTFDGWTEKKVAENVEILKGKLLEATKEIKQGKCVTLNPKKKGKYKIVIPDIVSQQIVDIVNKYSKKKVEKKCGTCWGKGLWPDGTAPMGPMDASDGMPTMACPECGANPNPVKK